MVACLLFDQSSILDQIDRQKMAHISLTPKSSFTKHLTNHHHLDKIKTESRERKRVILHLIFNYLKENLLENTAETLVKETQLDTSYQLCENVELDVILQEYQSYYYTKFQKYPKMLRKMEEQEVVTKGRKREVSTKSVKNPTPASPESEDIDFQFEIVPLNGVNRPKSTASCVSSKELEELKSNTTWADCIGLESTIETLKEAIVYPMLHPEIFKDVIPWKGVLLYGPPGTGKTLLAKALACESGTTFFNVTSSAFTSKWRGESEKLIKNLFDTAKLQAPSTIFFDEIDALVPSAKNTQHEASKRFRSELLTLLDGVVPNESQVFVLAATNSPWDLDDALLRRFDKRVLVDMPSKEARKQILRHYLRKIDCEMSLLERMDVFETVASGYSGSDLKNVAKEVTMILVRERLKSLETGNTIEAVRQVNYEDLRRAFCRIRPMGDYETSNKYYQWKEQYGAV